MQQQNTTILLIKVDFNILEQYKRKFKQNRCVFNGFLKEVRFNEYQT